MSDPPRVTCPRCGDLGPATLERDPAQHWVWTSPDHDCPARPPQEGACAD